MLEWHDCKTDPPKRNGKYIIVNILKKSWHEAIYENNKWYVEKWLIDKPKFCKWAEVELPKVERMNNISKVPKTSAPNPNLNYKPPIGNHIPVVEIIRSKDGVYDVYIDSQWQVSRNHIDNVLQHLADYIGTFTLKFKDLNIKE